MVSWDMFAAVSLHTHFIGTGASMPVLSEYKDAVLPTGPPLDKVSWFYIGTGLRPM